MNVDKDQILWLMRRQGHGDQANYARMELPDKIDTSNAQHAAMLSKYGVDPATLGDQLCGLGETT